jgi:hypothetical protein
VSGCSDAFDRLLDPIRSAIDAQSISCGYLTLVYQIDDGCRRLLRIGKGHTEKILQGFFDLLGDTLRPTLRYVCSDMWSAYLKVVAVRRLWRADRFLLGPGAVRELDAELAATLSGSRRQSCEIAEVPRPPPVFPLFSPSAVLQVLIPGLPAAKPAAMYCTDPCFARKVYFKADGESTIGADQDGRQRWANHSPLYVPVSGFGGRQ